MDSPLGCGDLGRRQHLLQVRVTAGFFGAADTEAGTVRSIGQEFRRVVPVAIIILATNGAIIAVAHLTAGGNSLKYIGILALKIALALYMFLVALLLRRRTTGEAAKRSDGSVHRLRRALTSTTTLLILGIVVITIEYPGQSLGRTVVVLVGPWIYWVSNSALAKSGTRSEAMRSRA